MKLNKILLAIGMVSSVVIVGCGDDTQYGKTPQPTPEPEAISPPLQAFAPNGTLKANIRRTQYGVPHISADNLESLGFGSGYAQAQDNLCVMADGFIKANSERSMYFGPHASIDFATGLPTSEDNGNLISDFAYKALKIRQLAENQYSQFSYNSRALMEGFSAGYNQYLADIDAGTQTGEPFCAGQPWVKPISGIDVANYIFSIALLPGAANFLDLIFYANPGDGEEYLPRIVGPAPSTAQTAFVQDMNNKLIARSATITTPETNPRNLGSNGWGLGKDKTENGKGMVLGNPHFPHTGNLRFWQSHLTIPGQIDVMGGSLVGMPGLVNIGFNKDVAWTHTFSTAEHFVMYNLELVSGDRLQYLFDGSKMPITKETVSVLVNAGAAGMLVAEKDIYTTAKGPMVEAPPSLAPFGWDDGQAFFIQDANMANKDPLDHWLAMNRATNQDEFQQAFKNYDGVIFNNTMYADKEGNAFYIDDSTVPGFSDLVVDIIRTTPAIVAAKAQAGFTILPGNTSVFSYDSPMPYERAPKLERSDFVQNSNNSFWSTNLAAPLENFSPLYGPERGQLSLRTRMGLTLMDDAAGDDGKFSIEELETALLSNRAYLAELVLADLISQCELQGDTPVVVSATLSKDVSASCSALRAWNGKQDNDSKGGALIREFAHQFDQNTMLTEAFDYMSAATTPNKLNTDGSALIALAHGALNLEAAGFAVDASLGEVQFVEKSLPDGSASGVKLPWPGSHNAEGGFNVFSTTLSGDDTLIPQHKYPPVLDVVSGKAAASGLTSEGYQIRSGSSWMMTVSFTDDGPKAKGLLTYSESSNVLSPSFSDQSELYSTAKQLRPLLFTEAEIQASVESSIELTLQK
ncbi:MULTISPECIES: acylase [Shewanella]|uniref:Acylase n=1 Tax=Shewanella psychromarinicola TaxID=2487742 RepID=A0A3N4DFN8_9GAMM|nr:acylase [Shewanella psychromarinicola]AZG33544.1 acylase [Shewanella psychromarinicola]MCL1082421.1 acylase [Shewanella psychromarinicola]RPA23662.1 acylase [Shewanella psychromarinicola]